MNFFDKLLALPRSRRFLVALGGAVAVFLQDTLGLDEQQTQVLVGIAISWILGDSINKTQ